MRLVEWKGLTVSEQRDVLSRPVKAAAQTVRQQVADILDRVQREGDSALLDLTAKFDRVALQALRASPEELEGAWRQVSPTTLRALEMARDNIERFHRQQAPKRIELPTMPGIRCFREARAIERVGFYIPGGSAPLPSTVLMLGVPAMIAANPIRVLCTPPGKDGAIDPVILIAAQMVGIEAIFKVGGAQAVAAMAYGTESIPKVDKIYGPGNSWVTEAKLQVAADPLGAAIDLPAGPSEVLVIADRTADPDFVAADLLSQAEHGPDSQVILVSTERTVAEMVLKAIERQLPSLPRREIAAQALQSSRCILVKDLQEALLVSDSYAPEHLILQIHEPEVLARQVRNAGSVFLGPWSPESAGDYASGTNHVLPTYGYARSYGGLSLDSFLKYITFQHLSKDGLAAIGPTVEELAALEGLEAHRRAVAIRLRPEEKL